MGKDKQIAKKRVTDKYYRLAKEQGYRSRAAFKLIQLNKKYEFLNNARVCIDLCAAPGGWMQVAAKHMASSSIIVGVDLAPIRPILNCVSITEDITTQKCRDALRKHVGTWKADVVLHDGAPNVGTAWLQDAYGQSELTLSALKLAVEFLRPGGTFVSKVFRSKDYNALLWVFNQLFKSVEATKPQASRNESAEIFVVCRQFVAAKYIDPKLLDPRHVFKDLDAPAKPQDIFQRTKQRRHRDGYADDAGPLLFTKTSVAHFIEDSSPIQMLGEYNQFVFDKEADESGYTTHPATTPEVKFCCEDLKVLNKKDFKVLLKWRLTVRNSDKCKEKLKAKALAEGKSPEDEENKEEKEEEPAAPLTAEQEEEIIDEELEGKVRELDARAKKLKKIEKKKRQKRIQRINLKMNVDASDVVNQTPSEIELFQMDPRLEDVEKLREANADDVPVDLNDDDLVSGEDSSSDDDEDYNVVVEKYLDRMYEQYLENSKNRTPKERIGKKKKKKDAELPAEDEFEGLSRMPALPEGFKPRVDANIEDIIGSDSEEEDESPDSDDGDNELEEMERDDEDVKQPVVEVKESKRAALWFNQPLFDDLLSGDSVPLVPIKKEKGSDEEEEVNDKSKKKGKRDRKEVKVDIKEEKPSNKRQKTEEFDAGERPVIKVKNSGATVSADGDGFDVVKADNYDDSDSDYDSDEMMETLALGTYAVRSRKFSDMVDNAYNRYAWNDDDLPAWFVDDENKHNKPTLPVTKEIMRELKEQFKAVNARPIKKVVEAKARKKMKAVKKMEKAKAQATAIAANSELSAREKMRQIEKLFKGQNNKVKPESVYVVAKKNGGRIRGNGKGKRVKIVDPRMKKDKRSLGKKGAKGAKGAKGGGGGKGRKGK